jgi:hypothetical protein
MKCIIYHNETTPLEILAICTRCKKGFIAYHKFNGITTMKKYVVYFVGTNLAPRSSLDCESSKKKVHVSPFATFGFFFFANKFMKDDAIQVVFFEKFDVVCDYKG